MFSRPHGIRFLASIRMRLRRVVPFRMLESLYTWTSRFFNSISGRGQAENIVTSSGTNSIGIDDGRDPNKPKGGKAKTKKGSILPRAFDI